jgi:NAD dependent epimerase/dehydratase family enzyme
VDTLLLSGQHVTPGALEAAGFAFRQPELTGALESILA